ncbi:MAG: iron-sulfur cluster assembly accessory protein [Thermoanaerobaculaceae bacterium]|nr:iron-sulfur cluster assembly accessory protein [Thermoanaerobaculaceae bacterium]MDI9623127.1 iron-sulfur cluster assembly accessory protein [Acidobacteriota bacterium]NLH10846.1 iron-sulfur cluster assembly accessory protein [Holophagae bacterium]HPW56566.1 iron-sulfur cluster assembly accessory protein [Thermoanaerobaculaceae bacterium]
MLTITDRAAQAVRDYAATMPEVAGKQLRIFVEHGGCSGVRYGFAFDDRHEGDTVLDAGGLQVLLDASSAQVLDGAEVDFVDDERGRGFVVDNPALAAGGCGCACDGC